MPKNPKILLKKRAKNKRLPYIVSKFSHRLCQKLKTTYQDRIQRTLSNACRRCSIHEDVGVDDQPSPTPTPKPISSEIEQRRYAFDRVR